METNVKQDYAETTDEGIYKRIKTPGEGIYKRIGAISDPKPQQPYTKRNPLLSVVLKNEDLIEPSNCVDDKNRSSDLGRKKVRDAVVICCSSVRCLTGPTSKVFQTLKQNTITAYAIQLSCKPEETCDVYGKLQKQIARCTVMVICRHTIMQWQTIIENLENNSYDLSRLVAYTIKVRLHKTVQGCVCVSSEAEDGAMVLLSHIRHILETPTRSVSTLQMVPDFPPESPGVATEANIGDAASDETSLPGIDETTLDKFVSSETLKGNYGIRGVFIRRLQSIYSPCGFGIERIIEEFSLGDPPSINNLTKMLTTFVIPECKKTKDFLSLVKLLKCDSALLHKELTSAILEVQYSLDVKLHMCDDVLRSMEIILGIYQQKPDDVEWNEHQIPLVVNFLVLIFQSALSHLDVQGHIQRLIKTCSQFMEPLQARRVEVQSVQGNVTVLLDMVTWFVSQSGKKNIICYNFKEALLLGKLTFTSKSFPKLSLLEQYTVVFTILQRLTIGIQDDHIKVLESFIVSFLGKSYKKSRREYVSPSLLTCVTQAVVHSLHNSKGICTMDSDRQQMDLLIILNLFLDSKKTNLVLRSKLLLEVEQLLFHKNKDVVYTVLIWFNRNHSTSHVFRDITQRHIERLLRPIQCQIINIGGGDSYDALRPYWCSFQAKIGKSNDVFVKCLVPGLSCFVNGNISDYKVRAKQGDTKVAINELEILRILQESHNNSNILALHAYQCRPMPLFYIVDLYRGKGLLQYLLRTRKDCNWLTSMKLLHMSCELVNVVQYLHSKKVVHRNLMASSFSLDERDRIVLTDFSLARYTDADDMTVTELDGVMVPTRWTSPESLLDGLNDTRTDVWMIGHLMYEMYTHGGQPYTELYGVSTDTVMEWVVFQDLKPKQWPCIPRDIHGIILGCLISNPDERFTLAMIKTKLEYQIQNSNRRASEKLPIGRVYDEDKMYPDIKSSLDKPKQIEKGIPRLFLDLRGNSLDPRVSYVNLVRELRGVPSANLEVAQSELISSDKPLIEVTNECNSMTVTEPVTQHFVEMVLPLLTGDVMKCLGLSKWPVVLQHQRSGELHDFNCSVEYECEKGESLLDIALHHTLGNPAERDKKQKYNELAYKVAEFMYEMHSHRIILCDVCAENIYYSTASGRIFMPRVGRLLHLNPYVSMDDSILGKKYINRKHWMPIEVLQSQQYSKESDVYMYAMSIYEFFMALNLTTLDPNKSSLWCVPFATVGSNKLLENLYRGEVPEKPDMCPEMFYNLMKECWNRDRTRRPVMQYIRHELYQRMYGYSELNTKHRHSGSLPVHLGSIDDDGYTQLKRNRSRLSNIFPQDAHPQMTQEEGNGFTVEKNSKSTGNIHDDNGGRYFSVNGKQVNNYEGQSPVHSTGCCCKKCENKKWNIPVMPAAIVQMRHKGRRNEEPSGDYADMCSNINTNYDFLDETVPEVDNVSCYVSHSTLLQMKSQSKRRGSSDTQTQALHPCFRRRSASFDMAVDAKNEPDTFYRDNTKYLSETEIQVSRNGNGSPLACQKNTDPYAQVKRKSEGGKRTGGSLDPTTEDSKTYRSMHNSQKPSMPLLPNENKFEGGKRTEGSLDPTIEDKTQYRSLPYPQRTPMSSLPNGKKSEGGTRSEGSLYLTAEDSNTQYRSLPYPQRTSMPLVLNGNRPSRKVIVTGRVVHTRTPVIEVDETGSLTRPRKTRSDVQEDLYSNEVYHV